MKKMIMMMDLILILHTGQCVRALAQLAILTSSPETHRAGEKILGLLFLSCVGEKAPLYIFHCLVFSELGLKLALLHLLVLQQ